VSATSPTATPSARPLARTLLGATLALAVDFALLAIGVGGVAPLLHHARAMALFATWLVATPALAILHPVRTHDPVAGRPDPPVMLALFAIPLLTPMLAALAERAGLAPLPGGAVTRWGGVAIAALGLALRMAAMTRLGSRFSPTGAIQRGHRLETAGPYGIVRHPGYIGAWLADLGVVLAFGDAVALALPALLAVAIAARVRVEERLLDEAFGEAYRAYRARVGGFVPRLAAGPRP
jgi:protein-S-isoprenylcysteine O-methyltransferase Ste14